MEEERSITSTPNNYKMALGTYIAIITLNVNGLNAPEGINSRMPEAEEQISELEDKMVEITSEEQN